MSVTSTSAPEERPLRADARRNRERIIASAVEVFARDGAEAQMDDVAREAGVGVGTLYRHFPTKDALLAELVRQKLARLAAVMAEALEAPDDPAGAFERSLRGAAAVASQDACMQEIYSSIGPDVFAAVADEQSRLNSLVGELIAVAKQGGEVREDLEVRDVEMLMCGLGAAMHSARPGFDWSRHLELILAAVRPTAET